MLLSKTLSSDLSNCVVPGFIAVIIIYHVVISSHVEEGAHYRSPVFELIGRRVNTTHPDVLS